jgi:hypothetical protein
MLRHASRIVRAVGWASVLSPEPANVGYISPYTSRSEPVKYAA